MASQGPRYPGTVTTEIGPSGDNDWTNPGNIGADDGAEAQITAATYDAGDHSYRLKAQNFGFTIPAGSTINGIVVEIDRRDFAGDAQDQEVRLYNGSGVLVGDDKQTDTSWPATLAVATYGSSSDTWAAGLAASSINDPDFGVALIVLANSANTDIGVDFIRVTVHYTAPATTLTPAAVAIPVAIAAPTFGLLKTFAPAALSIPLGPVRPGFGSAYATEVFKDNPIAYYRFNEAAGSTAVDQMGNHDGTYVNTPTLGVAGASGDGDTGIQLVAGSSEYMEASGFSTVPSALTLEAWVNSNGNANVGVGLMGWWDADDDRAQIFWASTEELRVGIQDDPGTTSPLIVSGLTDLSSAGWHHIVATQDGSNTRLYFDGALVGGPLARSHTGGTMTDIFRVGQYAGTSGSDADASFDEVAVYATALSAERILAHYEAALGISDTTFSPSPVVVDVAGFAPALALSLGLAPSAVAVPLVGAAPAVGLTLALAPAAVSIPLLAVAPDLAVGDGTTTLTPNPVAISLAEVAPSLALALGLAPAAVSIPVLGAAPSLGLPLALAPAPVVLALDEVAPAFGLVLDLAPAAVALDLSEVAPALGLVLDLAPAAVALPLEVVVPILVVPATQTFAPDPVVIYLLGVTPSVDQLITNVAGDVLLLRERRVLRYPWYGRGLRPRG